MRARAIVLAGFVGVAIAAAGCREPADTQAANVEPPPDQQAAAGPVSERSKPTVPDETATHEFTECERGVIRLVGDNPDTLTGNDRACMVESLTVWDRFEGGSGWLKLAELQVHFGHFDDARASLDRAKALGADEASLRRVEQSGLEAKGLDDKLHPYLPEGQVIIAVDEFSVPGKGRLRSVLSGTPCFCFFPSKPGYRFPHVTVGRVAEGTARKLWRSDELVDGRFGSGYDFLEITQTVAHVGGGRPDALVLGFQGLGASWAPAHAKVLQWRDGALVDTLAVDSEYEIKISDLNGDDVPEIENTLTIGAEGCHGKQSRWSDVYGWADGKWGLVSDHFPEQSEELARDLRRDLKEFPKDPERWYYLGVALENAGRDEQALEAYHKSVGLFHDYIQYCDEERWTDTAARARHLRDDAVERIAALQKAKGG